MKCVSIITPSYNRANLLPKAYESLKKQTSKDFEWIVVDDGSKDNTDEVVQKFISENQIEIKFIKKENGGKHTAVNRGVKEACGELVLILDSDDWLTNDAIETVIKDWQEYKNNEKICGLSYNKKVINKEAFKAKEPVVISNHIQYRYNENVLGDRAEVYRTSIMKEYNFPEIKDERFLSEAIVWNKIAYKYDTVYIDKDIYECEYLEDGLTSNSVRLRVNNPKGAMLNYQIMMQKPFNLKLRIKYSILYNTFSKFAKVSFKETLKNGNRFLLAVTKPIGDIVYLRWKKHLIKGD